MKYPADILAAIEAHRDLYLQGARPMWVVTKNPREIPGKFVARLHKVTEGRHQPTMTFVARDTLDALRRDLRDRLALATLARDRADDPVIVESWV